MYINCYVKQSFWVRVVNLRVCVGEGGREMEQAIKMARAAKFEMQFNRRLLGTLILRLSPSSGCAILYCAFLFFACKLCHFTMQILSMFIY